MSIQGCLSHHNIVEVRLVVAEVESTVVIIADAALADDLHGRDQIPVRSCASHAADLLRFGVHPLEVVCRIILVVLLELHRFV